MKILLLIITTVLMAAPSFARNHHQNKDSLQVAEEVLDAMYSITHNRAADLSCFAVKKYWHEIKTDEEKREQMNRVSNDGLCVVEYARMDAADKADKDVDRIYKTVSERKLRRKVYKSVLESINQNLEGRAQRMRELYCHKVDWCFERRNWNSKVQNLSCKEIRKHKDLCVVEEDLKAQVRDQKNKLKAGGSSGLPNKRQDEY